MKSQKLSSFLLCLILFCSCSQPLDFNQVESYNIKPSISASLAFFKIAAANFVAPTGAPIVTEITKIIDFKLFEIRFIKENTVNLDLEFEVANEFNRNITVEISLLDANNNLIYDLKDLKIRANSLNFKQKEIINITTNQNITNFTRVLFTISLDDKSTAIVASDLGVIEFKSAAIIYLETPL